MRGWPEKSPPAVYLSTELSFVESRYVIFAILDEDKCRSPEECDQQYGKLPSFQHPDRVPCPLCDVSHPCHLQLPENGAAITGVIPQSPTAFWQDEQRLQTPCPLYFWERQRLESQATLTSAMHDYRDFKKIPILLGGSDITRQAQCAWWSKMMMPPAVSLKIEQGLLGSPMVDGQRPMSFSQFLPETHLAGASSISRSGAKLFAPVGADDFKKALHELEAAAQEKHEGLDALERPS